jgi:hypothetical protein
MSTEKNLIEVLLPEHSRRQRMATSGMLKKYGGYSRIIRLSGRMDEVNYVLKRWIIRRDYLKRW